MIGQTLSTAMVSKDLGAFRVSVDSSRHSHAKMGRLCNLSPVEPQSISLELSIYVPFRFLYSLSVITFVYAPFSSLNGNV